MEKIYKTQIQVQFSSVTQSCLTLCNPMNCSTPGLLVQRQFLEITQIHIHQVGDAIQPSHTLSSLFPPAPSPSSIRVFSNEFNFSFFSVIGWGIGLDYSDIEWFALEMNRDHSVVFETASKYCISDSFVDHDGYSISSKGFLPTVVDIMVI